MRTRESTESGTWVGDQERLFPVALDTLLCQEDLAFDLYVRYQSPGPATLFRRRSYPLSPPDLETLHRHGVGTLYIPVTSLDAYQAYLKTTLLCDPTAPLKARLTALKEVNREIFLEALHYKGADSTVEVATSFGTELADLVYSHQTTIEELFSLLSHDYCTFAHVTNVSIYCVTLAKGLSINCREELAAIATGALLHDVGKRSIPSAVLNKAGQLTADEKQLIRKHPEIGFEFLCQGHGLSWAQLMMVYQHHERIDGRGYPVRVAGKEINDWAKICAIADVFDALTAYRPYARSRTPAEAIGYLLGHSTTAFDQEMVQCWAKIVRPSI